jgi:hypothetical protein
MIEEKITKGIWACVPNRENGDFAIVVLKDGIPQPVIVAEAFEDIRAWGEKSPECFPNALLISAAPLMLRMLRIVLSGNKANSEHPLFVASMRSLLETLDAKSGG